jgi:S-(hydroxymethyl)glutathione dehydrogenase / alcohol dehydrogenase
LAGVEVTLPDPVADQVRVRLTASGVCHSDLHAFNGEWTVPLPLVLGHEGAGVVEAVGPAVRDVVVGDHVVLSWFAPCRRCRACAAGRAWLCTGTRALEHPSALPGVHAYLGLGTFAEATVVPESAVVPIEEAVPPEVAALIGCSVATGVGAVLNTAGVRAGESAVVVGCGGVGQAIVLGLVLAGADPIVAVEESAERREQALALGATAAVEVAEGEFDHAFEAIGRAATLEALPGLLVRGGQAIIVGMPAEGVRVSIDPFDLADQGKRLIGCNYGSSVPAIDFPRLARLYLAGRLPLDKLVGRRRGLDQAQVALDDLRDAVGLRTVLVA